MMETNSSWSIDDSRNKFQFGCERGRLIENGKLGARRQEPELPRHLGQLLAQPRSASATRRRGRCSARRTAARASRRRSSAAGTRRRRACSGTSTCSAGTNDEYVDERYRCARRSRQRSGRGALPHRGRRARSCARRRRALRRVVRGGGFRLRAHEPRQGAAGRPRRAALPAAAADPAARAMPSTRSRSSGDASLDSRAAVDALAGLRSALPELVDDPHLLLPTEVVEHAKRARRARCRARARSSSACSMRRAARTSSASTRRGRSIAASRTRKASATGTRCRRSTSTGACITAPTRP